TLDSAGRAPDGTLPGAGGGSRHGLPHDRLGGPRHERRPRARGVLPRDVRARLPPGRRAPAARRARPEGSGLARAAQRARAEPRLPARRRRAAASDVALERRAPDAAPRHDRARPRRARAPARARGVARGTTAPGPHGRPRRTALPPRRPRGPPVLHLRRVSPTAAWPPPVVRSHPVTRGPTGNRRGR